MRRDHDAGPTGEVKSGPAVLILLVSSKANIPIRAGVQNLVDCIGLSPVMQQQLQNGRVSMLRGAV